MTAALDLAVALMQTEEVCELVTDGKYAYGSAGRYECFGRGCFYKLCLANF